MFTQCGVGLGKTSLATTISNLTVQNASKAASPSSSSNLMPLTPQFLLNETPNENWIPISSLSKLNFVCLGTTSESYFQNAIELYQQFLDQSGQKGQLFIAHIESEPNKSIKNGYNGDGVQFPTTSQWKKEFIPQVINDVFDINYKPFEANLNCGEYHKLESPILIWPTPMVRMPTQFISSFDFKWFSP